MLKALMGLVGLCSVSLGASAQGVAELENLVPNASFDNDIAGWTDLAEGAQTRVELEWSMQDVAGSPTSGSGLVINTSPIEAAVAGTFQLNNNTCIELVPGATYDMSVWVMIPPGQTETGIARLGLHYYQTDLCTNLDSGMQSPSVTAPGDWTQSEMLGISPPVTANSVQVGLLVFKNEAGGRLEVHFDDVAFVPEPSTLALALGALYALATLTRNTRYRAR